MVVEKKDGSETVFLCALCVRTKCISVKKILNFGRESRVFATKRASGFK